MSRNCSGITAPASSSGSPMPFRIRPSMSRDTRAVMRWPVNRTVARLVAIPCGASKSCTSARPAAASSTCPRRTEPSGNSTSANSP